MNLTIDIIIGAVYLTAMLALWHYTYRLMDERRLLTKALLKSGLTSPILRRIDSEDWGCSYGEATLGGIRVRFNTNRRPDGTVRLMMSSIDGQNWPEGRLPEGTLEV